MPQLINPDSSDFDKLIAAFSGITSIHSVEDVLAAFGLANLPVAQRYGIIFGCLTFFITISTVLALLVFGGSFARLEEQNKTGTATIPDAVTAREGRPLLLERLLEAQERMMANYPEKYKSRKPSSILTALTKMLLNIAPQNIEVADLIDEDSKSKGKKAIQKYVPEGYQENYVYAYRRCQDKPGGKILSGVPEARFEAYARAYAGCGIYTSPAYRRSYARMYEAVVCKNHPWEKKYSEMFASRPQDIHGRTIRLEALEAKRHAEQFFEVTNGDPYEDQKSYNSNKVWGFLDCGPFETVDELIQSPVFNLYPDEASFCIIESLTEKIIGVIHLTNDDPKNLKIQLELPIVKPSSEGTVEQMEACFLLLDRLFALGYRRIQIAVDSQDTIGKKVPARMGFTQEGQLPKHRISKEANRDSIIYGMLNSDWDKGARTFLFKKLHGENAQRADASNNLREGELEEQQRVLKEKKAMAEK